MAYIDWDEQQIAVTPEQEAENRRRMLGMLAGAGKNSVLGVPQPSPVMTNQPGTRGYDLSVSATNPPNVPSPRTTSAAPPSLAPSFTPKAPVLGALAQPPVRPNVMPERSDFPEGPPLPTWKKVLGLGLSALAGPQRAGPLAEQILNKPRIEADRQYNQATADWERTQTDAARAAQTEHTQAETEALRHPKPEKPENLQQAYADAVADAQSRGVDPSKDQKVQQIADAITSLQKQPAPPKDNKAVAGTVKGKPAWGVQTETGWIDPQTKKSIPDFAPAPNYAQVAPGLRTVDILDPTTGLPTVQTLGGKKLGVSGTGAYGHEAAQAGAVTRAASGLIDEIKAHKDKLGNPKAIIESALLGTPWADPETAGIRAQIATFAALQPSMHGFRGMNAVQQFEKVLGGIPNNPDALIAAINGITKTAGAINPALQTQPETTAPRQQGGFKPF